MLEFKTPQLADMAWVKKAMRESENMACEYCFGNLYMWSYIYHNQIAQYKNLLLAKDVDEKGNDVFLYPCGKGDKKEAVLLLQSMANEKKIPFVLYCLTAENKAELEALFPNQFSFEAERDSFDYIYDTETMANLAGRKYHGKRNHIAYFKKTYDYSYEPITKENIEECRAMAQKWKQLNLDKNPVEIENEYQALSRGMDAFFTLGFEGGLLRLDGEVIAFTFGEQLQDGLFCTHAEKAYSEIRGAYPAIHQEFTKHALLKYDKVNREEDTGSEGLRHAKESYYPTILLEKYTAYYKG